MTSSFKESLRLYQRDRNEACDGVSLSKDSNVAAQLLRGLCTRDSNAQRERKASRETTGKSGSNKSVAFFRSVIFTLLPNIKASRSVTVSWVWQKNMMNSKSGLAGDWRNNLRRQKENRRKYYQMREKLRQLFFKTERIEKQTEEWNIVSYVFDNRIILSAGKTLFSVCHAMALSRVARGESFWHIRMSRCQMLQTM